jgi:nucleoside diphosphate kinase
LERTLVLIKPDGVQRGLTGEIIKRLEKRGLKLVAAKFLLVSEELAKKHYAVHEGKPFYAGLIKYITSSPLMAMVWEGPQAVVAVRQTMGSTRPTEAAPGQFVMIMRLKWDVTSPMPLILLRMVKSRSLSGSLRKKFLAGKEQRIPGFKAKTNLAKLTKNLLY